MSVELASVDELELVLMIALVLTTLEDGHVCRTSRYLIPCSQTCEGGSRIRARAYDIEADHIY